MGFHGSLACPSALAIAIGLISFSGLSAAAGFEPSSDAAVREAVRQMADARGAQVDAKYSRLTGFVTFMTAGPGRGVPVPDPAAVSPEDRATSFLRAYGTAFGLGPESEPRVTQVLAADVIGVEHVRVQQLFKGIPVVAGELMVHLRGAEVVAANGKVLGDSALDTVPTIGPELALEAVRELASKHLRDARVDLSAPELQILNRGLLEGIRRPTHLTWFIVATNQSRREYVWVDAHRGGVVLHFNQMPQARNRTVYNSNNTSTLPGALMRSEGGPATGDADADAAYAYAGDTYDYFWTQHGRDSYDNAGAELRSSVHYCQTTCPYANAFWNGTQMVYGAGFSAADDVVAHELTHAVTERTANLFYYMQSGALNESLSDIFGETVDQTNTGGTDTPAVKWLLGEDVPGIGAIRNMMNPPAYLDPGKMSDTAYFYCGGAGGNTDGGGVHTNSGVPNHAYALMVDGGSYNGQAIAGIGLTKAGQIQYRALASYLLSGSDFLDYYQAVKQSCTDLVGTSGVTSDDCAQVGKALDAVELSEAWPCAPSPASVPALCPAGQDVVTTWADDFENTTSGLWSTSLLSGTANHWNVAVTGLRPAGTGDSNLYFADFAASGTRHLWAYDRAAAGNATVQMASGVTLPAGARLQFNHAFGFDNYNASVYDGGVVEYCTGACSTWSDAGSLISAGATYNGTIASGFGNPLAGRSAFTRESWGYTASQLDLSALAGQSARFRFRIGSDSSVDDYGWFIDDMRIYQCVASSCTYSIDPTSAGYPVAGGTGGVGVTTQAGCTWTAASDAPWNTVTSGHAGTGSGTVAYAVGVNYGPERTGTVTIAGQTLTITQAASTCSYSIDPTGASSPLVGGSGSVSVTGTPGCLWWATSNDAWITVTSGDSGSGDGTVGYSVAANTGSARTGTITIALQTFSVTQPGVLFTDIAANLQGLSGSAVAWGDYDNDGDLDVLVTGCSMTVAGNGCYTLNSKVYRNDGGGVFTLAASLTGVTGGSVAWGDYDRDGDLDIALSGCDWTGTSGCYRSVTKVYRNDGASAFTDIGAGLPAVTLASLAWGDYDNDGDLDLLAGPRLFRNDGGGVLTSVWTGSGVRSAWGDYDNDGDLDILLSGSSGSPYISRVYRNDGGGVFTDIGTGLVGGGGRVAWGDYDGDGNLDILLSGYDGSTNVSKVYRNDGGAVFASVWTGPCCAAAWGDYDNDGDLDILFLSKVYRNEGGASFVDAGEALPAGVSSLAWGDYDNDGDLDILSSGSLTTRVYRNGGTPANTVPAAPDGLVALTGTGQAVLSWAAASDGQTPAAGLTYNLRVGTAPGGANVVSPHATTTSGWRRVPARGNTDHRRVASLRQLAAGTYYWSVQAVDTAFAGSAFAGEGTFTLPSCTATLSATSRDVGAAGGTDSVGVTADAGCAWLAVSDASWITVASGASGSGNGTVDFSVAATLGPARSGTVTIGNQTFTVNQASGCVYSLNPTDASYRAGGGSNSFTITTPPTCAWTAVSNAAWITVTGTASGSGNGTVTYSVAANPSSERTGTITVVSPLFTVTQAQSPFVDMGAGLPGSGSAWGDYDNDGDLDILITNSTGSKVHRNDGGIFTDIGASLTGVSTSSMAWGDYDNDGDLDILLAGWTGSARIATVYRNDGGVFTDIGASLTGVNLGSVAWGDYDNDGDLDILLTGSNSSLVGVTQVYRNGGGVFTDIGASLTGVRSSSAAWGDYDNDGDLDILLTGFTGAANIARVYRNDGGIFTSIGASLTAVSGGAAAWGDYDNDGDLDIVLTGYASARIASVYRNDGGIFTDTGASLPGASSGSVNYPSAAAWGDYDNDGDLDVLLAEYAGSAYVSKVYRNDGGGAFTTEASLTGGGSAAWGDYDNDGDLDVLLAGKLYRTDTSTANTVPSAPTSLNVVVGFGQATLSWGTSSDTQTPAAGLTYNVRVGTTPGGGQIVAPMASEASGYRRVVQQGNANHGTTAGLSALSPGTYYWSVQAIDAALAGSAFANEGSFTVTSDLIFKDGFDSGP